MINVPPERSGQSDVLESKYSLVIAVAKRARQIVNKREPGIVLPHKPVTIALDEIEQGRIKIVSRDAEAPEKAVAGEAAETPPQGVPDEGVQPADEAATAPESPGPDAEKPQ